MKDHYGLVVVMELTSLCWTTAKVNAVAAVIANAARALLLVLLAAAAEKARREDALDAKRRPAMRKALEEIMVLGGV